MIIGVLLMKNVDDDIFNVINDMHEKSILNESTFIKYVERIILISIWWSSLKFISNFEFSCKVNAYKGA